MTVMPNVPIHMTRGTAEFTVLASLLRSVTANSDTIENVGWRGVVLFLNITAEDGAITLTPKVQVLDPVSGAWVDLAGAVFAAQTATTAAPVMLTIYPGIAETANVSVSDVLPRNWRVVATMSGTTSMTFSIGACYLP